MSQPTSTNEAAKPWYRQRWLWFVMSIPLASVILSSIMVTVAVKGKDSLVKDNYYKEGMEINQTIEQDQLADSLGLRPQLSIADDGHVFLRFASEKLAPQPFLTLHILHPTVADEDVEVRLLPSSEGFVGEIPAGLNGRRYIDLYAYDDAWRIREELFLPVESLTLNQD